MFFVASKTIPFSVVWKQVFLGFPEKEEGIFFGATKNKNFPVCVGKNFVHSMTSTNYRTT